MSTRTSPAAPTGKVRAPSPLQQPLANWRRHCNGAALADPDKQRAAAGFRSASRAAAAGGVTTFVDMPLNSDPATTTAALLGAKRRASKVPTLPHFGQVVQGSAEQDPPVHE